MVATDHRQGQFVDPGGIVLLMQQPAQEHIAYPRAVTGVGLVLVFAQNGMRIVQCNPALQHDGLQPLGATGLAGRIDLFVLPIGHQNHIGVDNPGACGPRQRLAAIVGGCACVRRRVAPRPMVRHDRC